MGLFRDRQQRVHDAAGKWLVRMRAGPSERDRRRFLAWYDSDPSNAEAYHAQAEFWDAISEVGLTSPIADQAPPRRHTSLPPSRYALAAAFLAAIGLASLLLVPNRTRPEAPPPREMMLIATALGEIREVPLGDGARLILDSDSAVQAGSRPGSGRLELKRGRARIDAAPGRAPLRLLAGAAEIEADGGIFDVRLESGTAIVTAIEGEVTVRSAPGAAPTHLRARQSLVAVPGKATFRGGNGWSTQWPRGRLDFERAPLAEVIAEANRYGAPKLRLADAGLGRLKVTGVYRAGDTRGLAESLAEAFQLELVELPDGHLLLRPAAARNNSGG
jgi:transmembrane sensor